jgi:ferritin-like metal-binding protein YciE
MTMTDEVVKGAIMSYVFENLEIASYTSLIAAATRCGDEATRAACERILPQEEAMAQWLLEHIPSISIEYLNRSASGQEAKK